MTRGGVRICFGRCPLKRRSKSDLNPRVYLELPRWVVTGVKKIEGFALCLNGPAREGVMAISRREFLKRGAAVPVGFAAAVLGVTLGSKASKHSRPDLGSGLMAWQRAVLDAEFYGPSLDEVMGTAAFRNILENGVGMSHLVSVQQQIKKFGAPRLTLNNRGGT